jgi:fimbrial isopeptide formation D2 family protein/LPXTG-motif cell wall-anchored protein
MTDTARSFWARCGVALAAIAVVLGGGASGTPANAAPVGPNVDPTATGSIIVHKLVQPGAASGLPNDGSALTQQQLAGLTPLAGVGFAVQRVTSVDLTTNAGWDATTGLTAAAVLADPDRYPLAASGSGTTDTAGDATFSSLPVGLYLVTETGPGGNPIAQPAPPFLVTLPLATGDDSWLYDVNVYPKNAVTNVTKTVDDTDAHGLGDDVDWTINCDVPYLAAGDPLDRFGLEDPLDARLAYKAARITAKTASGAPLALTGDDYVFTAPAAGENGTVAVRFTATGRAKLNANQGSVVTMTLTTTVLSIGDGSIENTATLTANTAEVEADALTSWGAVRVFKHGTADTQTGLSGAQFQVFRTEDDATSRTDPVTVGNAVTFTTDANGNTTLAGLRVGDYWIVETRAPTGYEADPAPIRAAVVQSSVADALVVRVADTQVPVWMLPLTGGNGAALFGASGTALLTIAAGAAVLARKRRRHAHVQV